MRLKFVVSAAVTIFVLSGATLTWAQKGSAKGKKADDGTAVPESINRQFQWEEKVVGPKDKGVDHKKIAAMQEQARREDAAKKKEPPKKMGRAEGIDAPASTSIPTQDIEKPAAPVARKSARKNTEEAPRQRD